MSIKRIKRILFAGILAAVVSAGFSSCDIIEDLFYNDAVIPSDDWQDTSDEDENNNENNDNNNDDNNSDDNPKVKILCLICVGDGKCTTCHGTGKACVECKGTGKHCAACNSSGRCSGCNGSGTCPECNGSGKCTTCGGTRACEDCNGSGTRRCYICDGLGYNRTTGSTCYKCNGSGVVACGWCNGSGTCQRCLGEGTCRNCHGNPVCDKCQGKKTCSSCGGNPVCKTCGGDGHCASCKNADGKCRNCGGLGYVWGFRAQGYKQCPDGNHPHLIDLGLPSGTKWACCNIGATHPEDYGGLYSWGETEVKDVYDDFTYALGYEHQNDDGTFSIYYYDIGREIAGTQYDAALVNWGAAWQMPTWEMLRELYFEATPVWTEVNGTPGYLITGPNEGSIFLPSAGGIDVLWGQLSAGDYGCYWSSSKVDPDYNPTWSCFLEFSSSSSPGLSQTWPSSGFSVRAVEGDIYL